MASDGRFGQYPRMNPSATADARLVAPKVGADNEEELSSIYYTGVDGTAIRLASNSPSGKPAAIAELKMLVSVVTTAVEEAGGLR